MIEAKTLPVEKACRAFDVSKQSFYKWKKNEHTPCGDGALEKMWMRNWH